MSEATNSRLLSIVILFLLGTTLFNTLRANKYGAETTTFRKEARYQLAATKEVLGQRGRSPPLARSNPGRLTISPPGWRPRLPESGLHFGPPWPGNRHRCLWAGH